MRTRILSRKIFFILISLWFVIAVFSLTYNSLKAFSEVRTWGGLSDTQKRQKIFGDSYNFINFLKNNTHGKQILFFSNDSEVYYLARYSLYPQEIYWNENDKISRFKYIATYNHDLVPNGYELVATFSAKSTNYGFLYHKK